MTCREKLKIENPEYVDSRFVGGCQGCPDLHGYLEKPYCCKEHRVSNEFECRKCWDREIPDADEPKATKSSNESGACNNCDTCDHELVCGYKVMFIKCKQELVKATYNPFVMICNAWKEKEKT